MLKTMAQQKLGSTSKTQPSRKGYCRGPTPVCCCASHPTGKLAQSSQLRFCSNKCRGWLLISSRKSLKTLRGTKPHPIPGWKIIPCQASGQKLSLCLWAQAWLLGQSTCARSPHQMEVSRGERRENRAQRPVARAQSWRRAAQGEGQVRLPTLLPPLHPNSYS